MDYNSLKKLDEDEESLKQFEERPVSVECVSYFTSEENPGGQEFSTQRAYDFIRIPFTNENEREDKAKVQDSMKEYIEYAKTPEPASSWVRRKYTKDQMTSTLGQTRCIREDTAQKDQDSSEKDAAKVKVKEAIVEQDENTGGDGKSSADE